MKCPLGMINPNCSKHCEKKCIGIEIFRHKVEHRRSKGPKKKIRHGKGIEALDYAMEGEIEQIGPPGEPEYTVQDMVRQLSNEERVLFAEVGDCFGKEGNGRRKAVV